MHARVILPPVRRGGGGDGSGGGGGGGSFPDRILMHLGGLSRARTKSALV